MLQPDAVYPAVLSISVRQGDKIFRGSGVLLAGGQYIVTAAHLLPESVSASDLSIGNSVDSLIPAAEAIYRHPQWSADSSSLDYDLAIIELSQAVTGIQGLPLYRSNQYLGESFVRVGYSNGHDQPQHIGTNVYDAEGQQLNGLFAFGIAQGTQVLSDYDNGSSGQNALFHLLGSSSADPTLFETLARAGDSGGPTLIDGRIAGITSYTLRDPTYDINRVADSSAGEIGADTRLYKHLRWIDYITRGNPEYPAPTRALEVNSSPVEPDYGSVINHFLLSAKIPPTETVRLWYQTVDGTASAGSDYEATSGWVTLEPGETSAAIAVRIYGDTAIEGDETIRMQVSDPSGRWLADGITLIAQHTLIDNDLFIG